MSAYSSSTSLRSRARNEPPKRIVVIPTEPKWWQPKASRASFRARVSMSPAPRDHHSSATAAAPPCPSGSWAAPAGNAIASDADATCSISLPSRTMPLGSVIISIRSAMMPIELPQSGRQADPDPKPIERREKQPLLAQESGHASVDAFYGDRPASQHLNRQSMSVDKIAPLAYKCTTKPAFESAELVEFEEPGGAKEKARIHHEQTTRTDPGRRRA